MLFRSEYADPAPLWNAFPSSTTGKPSKYTLIGTKLYWRRIPDATYTGKLFYYQTITALAASSDTNWLSTYYPDVYIYGACLELAAFLQDDDRVTTWKGAFDEAVKDITNDDQAARWSGPPVRPQFDFRQV